MSEDKLKCSICGKKLLSKTLDKDGKKIFVYFCSIHGDQYSPNYSDINYP